MININDHLSNNETIREYFRGYDPKNDVTEEDILLMEQANIIYEVHAYPYTNVGFYNHYSHDLNIALDAVISAIENDPRT